MPPNFVEQMNSVSRWNREEIISIPRLVLTHQSLPPIRKSHIKFICKVASRFSATLIATEMKLSGSTQLCSEINPAKNHSNPSSFSFRQYPTPIVKHQLWDWNEGVRIPSHWQLLKWNFGTWTTPASRSSRQKLIAIQEPPPENMKHLFDVIFSYVFICVFVKTIRVLCNGLGYPGCKTGLT